MAPRQRRLFQVFFKGQTHFFQSRKAARAFGREHGLRGAIIHRGPDHFRGETDGTFVNTPSSKGGAW